MISIAKDAPDEASADHVLNAMEIDWSALIALLVPEFKAAGINGLTAALTRLGLSDLVSWDEVIPEVERYAEERAAELVGMHRSIDGRFVPSAVPGVSIAHSTREMLRGTVRQAIAEGWGVTQIQARVASDHAFSPARALNIARTETAFARNRGGLIGAKASGAVRGKRWVTSEDACEACEENAAQGVVGLEEEFPSGDIAPPGHPSCRCSLDYELADRIS